MKTSPHPPITPISDSHLKAARHKILVVDDNPANIDIMLKLLEAEGYNLAFARSGPQALKVVGHFCPDLILLDVMMPGMDGYEVCRRLKKEPESRHIPIIFVTAKKDTTDIVSGFRAGGVDYISKPFRQEEVLSRVGTHLQLRTLINSQAILIKKLEDALAEVKTLSGMLPICSVCKKVRDDDGYWHQIESYIAARSQAEFSHGLCQKCLVNLYPEYEDQVDEFDDIISQDPPGDQEQDS